MYSGSQIVHKDDNKDEEKESQLLNTIPANDEIFQQCFHIIKNSNSYFSFWISLSFSLICSLKKHIELGFITCQQGWVVKSEIKAACLPT